MTEQERQRADRMQDFYKRYIKNDTAVKEHLLKYTWTSGSSTVVYPVEFDCAGNHIVLQWDSRNTNTAKHFIERMKQTKCVSYAYFNKSDGSCPSVVVIGFDD